MDNCNNIYKSYLINLDTKAQSDEFLYTCSFLMTFFVVTIG